MAEFSQVQIDSLADRLSRSLEGLLFNRLRGTVFDVLQDAAFKAIPEALKSDVAAKVTEAAIGAGRRDAFLAGWAAYRQAATNEGSIPYPNLVEGWLEGALTKYMSHTSATREPAREASKPVARGADSGPHR